MEDIPLEASPKVPWKGRFCFFLPFKSTNTDHQKNKIHGGKFSAIKFGPRFERRI